MFEHDIQLVKQLLAGDATAFDGFFGEYYPKLYRFALRRLAHDAHAAEDIAQSTLCTALKALPTFRGEATLMTWLCTLCRRELSARFRSASGTIDRMTLREDDPDVRTALESLFAPDEDDPLLRASAAQTHTAVIAALDYLPQIYAQVLEMKYVQELSVVEISTHVGRTAKATESLLTRARDAFREAFAALHDRAATPTHRTTP
jgi:RNA polymerase sigma-70 factor (ECF subfamily)